MQKKWGLCTKCCYQLQFLPASLLLSPAGLRGSIVGQAAHQQLCKHSLQPLSIVA